MQEQYQRAFAHSEPAEGDRQHLEHQYGRRERDYRRDRNGKVEGAEDQSEHRDLRRLEDDRGAEHGHDLARLPAQPFHTEVHRTDELCPALLARVPAGQARVPGDEQDQHQRDERRRRDNQRDPCVRVMDQRRAHGEPREHEEGQRDEAGEPLDHDRGERHLRRADGVRGPGNADDVAPDGRRQHIAHEEPDDVVGKEGGHAHPHVEEQQDSLPAPGREDNSDQGGEDRGDEQDDRRHVVPVGDGVVDVRGLGDDECKERRAHHDPQRQLPLRSGAANDRGSLRHRT